MFQISVQVMDKFEAEAADRAVGWHQKRLLARFPELSAIPPPQQYEFARRNRLSAIALEIEEEEDIAVFLDCAVMYGEEFVREPWAREIFEEQGLSGTERMDLLSEVLAEIGVEL